MVTYVNVGPYKSGTTSFYKMCCKYKSRINVGKIKEPLRVLIVEKNKPFDIYLFLSNWDINYNNDILLDGTGYTGTDDLTLNFKQESSSFIDDYKFIVLIRDPVNYYSSRLFFSLDSITEFLPNNNYIEELKILVRNKLKDKEFFIIKGILKHLEIIEKRYSKNSIFILPIKYFEQYKDQLSAFLMTDLQNFKLENFRTKKTLNYSLIKTIIENEILNNKNLLDFMYDELIIIDKKYNSNLSKLYPRRIK